MSENGVTIEMCTRLQPKKVHFKWTIEKWNLTSHSQKELKSQIFKLPDINKDCFLKVNLGNNILLMVHLEMCKQLEKCIVSAQVINNQGSTVELIKCNSKMIRLNDNDKIFETISFVIVEEYFDVNTLVFVCKIDYVLEKYKLEKIFNSFEGKNNLYGEKMLVSSFDKLYKNHQLYDVKFVLGQHELNAHSFILATVSPYFLAMFSHEDKKENQERIVNFTNDDDITVENLKIFLDYIYGCVSVYDNKEIVCELIVLADKFDVSPLKIASESYLIDIITTENVAELLLFAEKYNCNALKKEAIKFSKCYLEVVKETKEFKDICKNIDLLMQII